MAENPNLDAQIRDAAVAQLNQNQKQALEKALKEAENETVDDTPIAQQQHLQKILKLTIAKATNEYSYTLEHNAQKLIEQISEEDNEAPAKATAATMQQAAMNDKLEDATINALNVAQASSIGDKEKKQTADATTPTPSPSNETSQTPATATKPTEPVASNKEKPATGDAPSKQVATEEKTKASQVSQNKPSQAKNEEAPKAQAETQQVAQASIKTKPSESSQQHKQAIQLKTEQWMYIGQFKDGAWAEKTIAIGDTLPQTGQQYTVSSQSVNVRAGLPNKQNMPEVITNLGNKAKVTLVELKASGKQGYYWGKIER